MQGKNKKKKKKFTRYTAFTVVTIIVISAITSRLAYLQIVKADEFKLRADSNYIRNISTMAPRGDIVDRNNVVLATSKQSFNLTYMETKEIKKDFFKTMKIVFKVLDENKEIQEDDFPLKVKPYVFDFKAVKASDRKWMELMFKKDRGFADKKAKELYNKEYKDLDKEKDKDKLKNIDEELLKITPEQTFKELCTKTQYEIDGRGLSIEEQRRYMVIKDTIKMQSFSGYKPVVIAKNIKRETAFKIYERLSELPGIDVGNEPLRYYPYGELGSSYMGYISKINSMYQERYEEKGYDVSTDYVGSEGIEKVFESRLRGSKGLRTVKVNKYGRIVEELFKKSPYPGENIQLTIDAKLQNAAEKALDDTMAELRKNPRPDPQDSTIYTANATRGAAVVTDARTGEVLALVSRPGFDPNIFTIPGKLTDEASKKYFNPDLKEFGENYIRSMGLAGSESGVGEKLNQMFPIDKSIKNNTTIRSDMYDIVPKPFFNYATASTTPPGSTFKPITAIAGLEEGVIEPGSTVYDSGTFSRYGGIWHCWKRGGHGTISVVSALKESCNYFFYNVGSLLYEKYTGTSREESYDVLAKYANKFGLGVRTGIEISEKSGEAYNFKTSEELKASLFYYSARDILKVGYEPARGFKFQSIDINIKKGDSGAVKKIKESIKKTIKESITTDPNDKGNASTKYINELQGELRGLVNTFEKEEQTKYTEEQLNKASQAVVNFCVFDANTQIYTPGNVVNAAIGQGGHQFTPLQLANYVATIANGGHRNELHLLKKAYDEEENTTEEKQAKVLQEANLKDSTIDVVKEGMRAVTSGEGGTAKKAFSGFPMETAGKTGSSTYSATQNQVGRTSYAVYVGYAPADNPEIAVSVIIFDGGHGGYAAPVARAIYEQYFSERLKKQYPGYLPRYNYKLEENKNDKDSITDTGIDIKDNTISVEQNSSGSNTKNGITTNKSNRKISGNARYKSKKIKKRN